MKVMKFGGSSVSSPERIKAVIRIIKENYQGSPNLAIVVSAFGGVTDELIKIGQLAAKGSFSYHSHRDQLIYRHKEAFHTLAEPTAESLQVFEALIQELSDALHGVQLIKELSKRSLDFIMSFGERFSAFIISLALKKEIANAIYLDAREIIVTDANFGHALINYPLTNQLIQHYCTKNSVPVVTGFIGATKTKETTTLGRGGSDFTAAILGAGLYADIIEIWTDVDGVMTADPRKVKQAFPIKEMSYKEALEMSHFGAKVLHPPTVAPALQLKIPLLIKNTFNPTAPGTLISHESKGSGNPICGISSIDKSSLIRVEGSGMVGVCGIAMRLFSALAKKEINVILISQGSSEHSICIAVSPEQAHYAKEALEHEFALEQKAGLIDPISVEENFSIIAVVGEQMRHVPGIAGRLFGALGKNGINISAIVQGSSEYNITAVIKREDETKSLNAIHEDFFLSDKFSLHLFLVGAGLIGSTLLKQIHEHLPQLSKDYALDMHLCGIANSKKMIFNPNGIDLVKWEDQLNDSSEKMDISLFIEKMKELNLVNSIFVDCTSNQDIADAYPAILESAISIVTPNKKANSGSYENYCKLKKIAAQKNANFLYETNVGAGLPILNTIANLKRCGDKIIKVEAILSGTLSYLFNNFNEDVTFSEAVRQAQQKGFTEPDPREDLNGKDVARKLLILARECGYPLEADQIKQDAILPDICFKAPSVEAFYFELSKIDSEWLEKYRQAQKNGKKWKYIASFENGKAKISLDAIDEKHPFYNLSGSDNIVAITTNRYKESPLVIKGQGAGAEVTAGEVFADIIRCRGR